MIISRGGGSCSFDTESLSKKSLTDGGQPTTLDKFHRNYWSPFGEKWLSGFLSSVADCPPHGLLR